MAWLLVATVLPELGTIATVVSGGATTVVMVLLIWLVVKGMPDRETRHSADMKDARKDFKEELSSERALYREQAAAERELHRELGQQERDECNKRHTELVQAIKSMQKKQEEHYELSRVIKHETANIAQSRANDAALRELRAMMDSEEGVS